MIFKLSVFPARRLFEDYTLMVIYKSQFSKMSIVRRGHFQNLDFSDMVIINKSLNNAYYNCSPNLLKTQKQVVTIKVIRNNSNNTCFSSAGRKCPSCVPQFNKLVINKKYTRSRYIGLKINVCIVSDSKNVAQLYK